MKKHKTCKFFLLKGIRAYFYFFQMSEVLKAIFILSFFKNTVNVQNKPSPHDADVVKSCRVCRHPVYASCLLPPVSDLALTVGGRHVILWCPDELLLTKLREMSLSRFIKNAGI